MKGSAAYGSRKIIKSGRTFSFWSACARTKGMAVARRRMLMKSSCHLVRRNLGA
ncbi:hypothetical protein BDR03DRAFT_946698 [Suillus americanus]|nr:hypothetical protein BDR03DRAFT_946698 [Suillus americanus]